jgi:hypothetical protein
MTTVYQITDWQAHFESSRSREIENPAMVLMPNKQHGMGFLRVTRLPGLEGSAAFGLWCMMLQACSRQKSNEAHARAGWLTDDGTPTGQPWDAEDMALRWCLPVEFVQKVLNLLCSPKVGWMKAHNIVAQEVATNADQLPIVCRSSADELPTEQNRTEQNRTEIHPNAGDISTDQEIAKPAPQEPPTGNDSDLWRYRIGAEPWARTLKRAGCKIGPNNWRAWQGLIERAFNGQADTCAAAAAKVKPEDRWPDQVEAAARTAAPSAIASKYADRQARIKTVQVTP